MNQQPQSYADAALTALHRYRSDQRRANRSRAEFNRRVAEHEKATQAIRKAARP